LIRAARLLFVILGLFVAQSAFAVEPDEILPDPNLEARARVISGELRCLVCQNQSIDDSAAPLARDLRLLVRERLKQGDSDWQVMDYLVQRFGEFILLRPRFEWQTLLLWIAPFATLALGAIGAFVAMRHRRAQSDPEEEQHLSDAELAELKQLE
jgi:cytochrome c-type biogenesis protein CcmH